MISTKGTEAEVSTVPSVTEETNEDGKMETDKEENEKSVATVETELRPAQPQSDEGKTSRPPSTSSISSTPTTPPPQLDSGSSSTPIIGDPLLPLAPLPCQYPAFLCQDAVTCIRPNKIY